MAEHDGLEHLLFGQLLGLGLHHHHRIHGAGHDQVEIALGHLVDHGVEYELAVDHADARGSDGTEEREPRQRQRRGGCDQCDDVGIILHVMGKHRHDDLRLVLEAFHEQRPDGPVDQARGERFLLARAAFTLEKAAGDFAGGVGLLLVVDGQREEVDAGPNAPGGDHGRQHAGVTVLGEHSSVGLTRDAPRFKSELASAPFNFHAMCVEHLVSRFSL